MNWEQLLSLKRQGDTLKRLRLEQDETRIGFEVDYDRIIFSSSFRSLQDKTQVIPFSKTSFVHTRLTHSLELSEITGHTIETMLSYYKRLDVESGRKTLLTNRIKNILSKNRISKN